MTHGIKSNDLPSLRVSTALPQICHFEEQSDEESLVPSEKILRFSQNDRLKVLREAKPASTTAAEFIPELTPVLIPELTPVLIPELTQ